VCWKHHFRCLAHPRTDCVGAGCGELSKHLIRGSAHHDELRLVKMRVHPFFEIRAERSPRKSTRRFGYPNTKLGRLATPQGAGRRSQRQCQPNSASAITSMIVFVTNPLIALNRCSDNRSARSVW
jgi:hypothetical protein